LLLGAARGVRLTVPGLQRSRVRPTPRGLPAPSACGSAFSRFLRSAMPSVRTEFSGSGKGPLPVRSRLRDGKGFYPKPPATKGDPGSAGFGPVTAAGCDRAGLFLASRTLMRQRTGAADRLVLQAQFICQGTDEIVEQRTRTFGTRCSTLALRASRSSDSFSIRPKRRRTRKLGESTGMACPPRDCWTPRRPRNRWRPGSEPIAWPPA